MPFSAFGIAVLVVAGWPMPVVSFEMQVKHIPKKGTKLSSYLHQAGFNDEAYILQHHIYYQF